MAGHDPLPLGAEDHEHLLAAQDLLFQAQFAQAAIDADLAELGLELDDAVEVLLDEEPQRDGQLAEVGAFFRGHYFGEV